MRSFVLVLVLMVRTPGEVQATGPGPADSSSADTTRTQLHAAGCYLPASAVVKEHLRGGLTLVDIRGAEAFDTLHVPGSLNIDASAIKVKGYLMARRLILIDAGHSYTLTDRACVELTERGFDVHAVAGGLAAWRRHGGSLEGDKVAASRLGSMSPQDFFAERRYANWKVVYLGAAPPRDLPGMESLLPLSPRHPVEALAEQLRTLLRERHGDALAAVVLVTQDGSVSQQHVSVLDDHETPGFVLDGGLTGYRGFLDRQQRLVNPGGKKRSGCSPGISCGN